MDPETEVVTAVVQPTPGPTLQERMAKSVAESWPSVATDDATAVTPPVAEPPVAEPGQQATATVETAPESKVDDTPYSPEQIADPKFWDSLDEDGWAKAARLHPVETKRVKASYSAGSKIAKREIEKKRATETTPPVTQTASEEPAELAPEQQAILDAIELGTPQERFRAYQQLAAMTVESVPAIQSTREKEKRAELMQQARDLAVNGDEEAGLPPFPELEDFDDATLNAAYAKDPEARAMASIGTPQAIALAARRVGQTLLSQKRADSAKFEAEQEKIRRNANTPVSNAVVPGAGGPIPTKPQSPLEFAQGEWGKVAVRANQ
jgi:hypothetical protein